MIILAVQIIVLIYFGSLKKGMHFDECFSYFNTNNSMGREAYDRTFVSSEDIMKDFYVLDGERFNYKYVITLQSYDVHPPVFYLALHTVCSIWAGTFSMWQGLLLNILYSVILSVFAYLILKKLDIDKDATLLIMLILATNPGIVSDAMYIRMYCMMAMWMMMSIYIHICMDKYGSLKDIPVKYIVFNAVLAYLGFLTHYYYLLFLIFIEAGFFLPRCFKSKREFLGTLKILLPVLGAGIFGVITYPACLGHVNSGYRGQEVKSYLFNLKDMKDRLSFFGGLLDRFVFGYMGALFCLITVLLILWCVYKSRKNEDNYKLPKIWYECLLIPFAGYFLISAKGSLLGDETMMRYQMSVYPVAIILTTLLLYYLIKYALRGKAQKIALYIVFIAFIGIDLFGLWKKNVFYLYENNEMMNSIASEHKDDVCIYIYNDENNKYLLWNDFAQLAKYDEVYFVDINNKDVITEEKIVNAENLVVYISVLGESDVFSEYTDLIYSSNKNVHEYEKLYDAMYAKAYYFE